MWASFILVALAASEISASALLKRQDPPSCKSNFGTTIFGDCECLCGGNLACGDLPGKDGFDCTQCSPVSSLQQPDFGESQHFRK